MLNFGHKVRPKFKENNFNYFDFKKIVGQMAHYFDLPGPHPSEIQAKIGSKNHNLTSRLSRKYLNMVKNNVVSGKF